MDAIATKTPLDLNGLDTSRVNCSRTTRTGGIHVSAEYGSTAEGDGYVVGIASNYAEMASELHIVDAQRMEEGAIAVVKLPFRLRGGTHVN